MSASPTELPALDPVLAGVYRRGYAIRRQRTARRLATGVVALQLLVAIPFALAHSEGGGGRNVRIVAPATQEETTTSTTAVPTVVEGVAVEAAATTTSAPAATPAPTTTLVCRNSSDPRCGPFRWDPVPVNQPVTVAITFTPTRPKVGEEVHFTVRISDPDASQMLNGTSLCIDDGKAACVSGTRMVRCDRYGPWDPPPVIAGSWTHEYTHAFDQPGTFTASELALTGSNECGPEYDPYSSQANGSAVITVDPTE